MTLGVAIEATSQAIKNGGHWQHHAVFICLRDGINDKYVIQYLMRMLTDP